MKKERKKTKVVQLQRTPFIFLLSLSLHCLSPSLPSALPQEARHRSSPGSQAQPKETQYSPPPSPLQGSLNFSGSPHHHPWWPLQRPPSPFPPAVNPPRISPLDLALRLSPLKRTMLLCHTIATSTAVPIPPPPPVPPHTPPVPPPVQPPAAILLHF